MSNFNDRVNKFKKRPGYYTKLIALRTVSKIIPDKVFIKSYYHILRGDRLNLRKPQTFSEKLQWLKLYDRNPIYTIMADKYRAKDYVGRQIGMEHIIPLIGVWDNAKEIDFNLLPNKFVLKCNHDSRSWIFCKNKAEFNVDEARKILNKKLKRNHYLWYREWAYKNIKHRIIAEEYLEEKNDSTRYLGLIDYKFFCTDGTARMMYITHDIDADSPFDAFDMNFNHLDMFSAFNNPIMPKKPKFFDEMRIAAEKLSKGIPFVRVDFYIANDQYYFGEMTFYPMAGFFPKKTSDWELIIGDWIKLPEKSKNV